MKRRGGSRKQGKKRRTTTPKVRKTRRVSAKSPEQLDRLKRERDEALEQQAATAEVLSDEAESGQILISPRVLMAVEKDITVEPIGDFALKGIRRPLAAYNVLNRQTAH